MTGEIRDSMAKLREIAPRLNQAADAADRLVREVDSFLEGLGLGVTAETAGFHSGTPHMGRDLGRREVELVADFTLAYGPMPPDRAYRIHVVETVSRRREERPDPDDFGWDMLAEERTPWESCPREVKLRSVAKLPELLDRILSEAERAAVSVEENTAAVHDMLAPLAAEKLNGDGATVRPVRRRSPRG